MVLTLLFICLYIVIVYNYSNYVLILIKKRYIFNQIYIKLKCVNKILK